MPLCFNSLPFMPWYIFWSFNTCNAFRAILRRGIKYNWFQRPVVDHWGLRRHALVNLWRTGGETLVNKPGMVRNICCILIDVPNVIGEVDKTSNFPYMSSFFHQEIQIWNKFLPFLKRLSASPPLSSFNWVFFFNAKFTNTYVACLLH